MSEYDSSDLTPRDRDRIVKTAVSPRPIAWISTRDAEGRDNLAPFSSYNYAGSANPVVVFTTSQRDGALKDTPRNALERGEFAVNVVTADVVERMDHTAADPPAGTDEFELAGVERAECTRIDAPRVADAPVTMECTLYDSMEVYDRQMILGDVVHFHVDESVTRDGKIDSRELTQAARLGGPYYTYTEPIEFERRY